MGDLKKVRQQLAAFNASVESRVNEVRENPDEAKSLLEKWREIQESVPEVETPTGLKLPRLPLPLLDEPGAIARYLYGEGLPGEFPYLSSSYAEMYLDPMDPHEVPSEEPTRLFAGLGTAKDTNERFHFLTKNQRSHRMSTAFDGPTLYGMDSDEPGVFGKIGEGGVAIDTVEDMEVLFAGFDLAAASTSVSMTINGPAPTIMAMFVAAAKRRFGDGVVEKLRGTVQADILKEVQGQNEVLFPVQASLRFLLDMMEYSVMKIPRWYPVSISGYHISQAGATPVQQAAYTLSNGFAYAEMMRDRGLDVRDFAPRFSFFLDCGLDVEFMALARICRKIWAVGMRDVYGADQRGQKLKLHTQTSGRSLVAAEFKNNLTRTAVELLMAYMNATNSCHSNSADEPFTTPSEEYVKLASHAQSIMLEESGLFRHMMNGVSGSPGMKAVERAVEQAILEEFEEIDRLGGVLGAMEHRYQRSQIQASSHRYEQQIMENERRIIGLNRYAEGVEHPEPQLVRISNERKEEQVLRIQDFKKRNQDKAGPALERLGQVVRSDGNVFEELIDTVETCTLGQITKALQAEVGKFRPMM
ncbi:fused isobutyryl-CoA mutase [Rubritalea halochordaticola]|uniref:Fused isobutyryl-CoA mutase n=1 Tax=Rubritalea halochordaticola TaxID=714537 RepID=A0ABP9V3Y3_9BACT